jgi:eukaryotic-like serine/threonine-protein kinase
MRGRSPSAAAPMKLRESAAFSAAKYVDERQARRDADQQTFVAVRNAKAAERNAAEAGRQRARADRQRQEAERQRDSVGQNLYYADMRLSNLDIGHGNSSRALDSLLSHSPRPIEPDRRGWEWYYLLGRSHEAEEALYGHTTEISGVAWSPDGSFIASVSLDGSARVWDAKTWKLFRTFHAGPTLKKGVCWSPDSRKLAWGSVSDESAVRIWNRDTDEVSVLTGHGRSVWAVAWSGEGKFIAAGTMKDEAEIGSVFIWDAERLEKVEELSAEGHVLSLSWSADDRVLADGRLLWDVASRRRLSDSIVDRPQCAAWHPSKPLLAVGAWGRCVIWDHARKERIAEWPAHKGQVTDIKWSPDGTRLLTCGFDGYAMVWNSASGELEHSTSAHAGAANSASWEPNGNRFASGGTDGVIRVWASPHQKNPAVINTELKGSDNLILNLAWSSDSSAVFVAGYRAAGTGTPEIRSYDAASGGKLAGLPLRIDKDECLISLRHTGTQPKAATQQGAMLQLSELPPDETMARLVPPTVLNGHWFTAGDNAVLSPEGSRVAFCGGTWHSTYVIIQDIRSSDVVKCTEVTGPLGIAWSPSGRRIAVVGRGDPRDDGYLQHAGWVHVFDSSTGDRVRKLRIGTERVPGSAVAWSRDESRIAAANEVGFCGVWDVETGEILVGQRIHHSKVNDLGWSSDDRRIASGGSDHQIQVWDSTNGQQVLALDTQQGTRHIRWSPDGHKLAALSTDGVIQVWDATRGYQIPETGFWKHLVGPINWEEYRRLTSQNQWSDAALTLRQMIAEDAHNDEALYQLALVSLHRNDYAGYRDACKRMVVAFRDSDDRWKSYQTAWACALRPGVLEDYEPVIALAEQVVSLSRDASNPGNSRAAYHEALGAVLLRAGRYEEALTHLETAHKAPPDRFKPSASRIEYLMAMTHQAQRRSNDARMWFDRANREAEQERNNAEKPPDWQSRLILDLFAAEATELVRGGQATGEAHRPTKRSQRQSSRD